MTSKLPPSFKQAIKRIEERNPLVHAFLSTRIEQAKKEFEALREAPSNSPLHGLPFSLKDVWEVAGEITTAGSFRFRDRRSPADSEVARIFREAGAVLVGKTACSDLSIAPETQNYLSGYTLNPRDLSRTAGGSSGGAAAAVADGMSAFDWGTDIGGSIRVPAGFCGVFGMRLSNAAWLRHGDFPAPPPAIEFMNGHGPITANLDLMRNVLAQAAGKLRKAGSSNFPFRGIALYPLDHASAGEWPDSHQETLSRLQKLGIPTRTAEELPPLAQVRNIYASLWSSHLFDLVEADTLGFWNGMSAIGSALVFRGILGDKRFHPKTARVIALISLGRLLFRDSKKALENAKGVQTRIQKVWDAGELIVLPTTTFPAPPRGKLLSYWNILNCIIPGNVADATALAFPFGSFGDGLPRSLQLMGPPGSENLIMDLAGKITVPSGSSP